MVAYQGLKGSYSQQTIVNFSDENGFNFEPFSTKDFRDLFDAIDKDTGLGMVPIENSTAGSVAQCYDLFLEYDFEIIGEYKFVVNHCLLAKAGVKLEDIREVYSHPQALAQCSKFIEKFGIVPVSYLDTAASAEKVIRSGRDDIASISSGVAANEYGLEILKEKFQNNEHNVTRFLLVKKKGKKFDFEKSLPKSDKSSVIFRTRSIPAALYKCLGGFATNGINLTKIESRPVQGEEFHYIFYLDFEGVFGDSSVKLALEELEFYAQKVIRLGSYAGK